VNINNFKIAVLYGGWSDEADYTAHNEVKQALKFYKSDYKMITINSDKWLEELINFKPDVAFITNQGNFGEDGLVQAVLDMLDIKYIGSGVMTSSIGMNKYIFKKLVETLGFNTPKYILKKFNDDNIKFEDIVKKIGIPFIVKPVSNGASVGISLIKDKQSFVNTVNELVNKFGDLLFEEFISHPKREIGAGILDINGKPTALQPCVIEYEAEYFSNEVKFSGIGVSERFDINNELTEEAAKIALRLHNELGCSGLSRTDFVVDKNNKIYILEINTLPGLLNDSLFPNECIASGISYNEMVKELILNAYNRKPFQVNKVTKKR